jgi:hypothetical protein
VFGRYPVDMAEPVEHLQVDADPVVSAYLRRRCLPREDTAATAARALHELAMADAADRDAGWQHRHEGDIVALAEDGEAALAEAV